MSDESAKTAGLRHHPEHLQKLPWHLSHNVENASDLRRTDLFILVLEAHSVTNIPAPDYVCSSWM